MKRQRLYILLVLLGVGLGGNVAWQAYEDHQRDEALKILMDGVDCSSCSIRKASLAVKAAERRAQAEAIKNGQWENAPSLIEALQDELPASSSEPGEPVLTE